MKSFPDLSVRMDHSNVISGATKGLSSIVQNVRILLVDHDRISLMSLKRQFQQQFYKVTTAESSNVALSVFREDKNYFNLVVADRHMPESNIFEFVHQLHSLRINIPILLIHENLTADSAREAMANGVCFNFQKPLSHYDIASLWQHISRETGDLPYPIDSNMDGDERNANQSNLERKKIHTNPKSIKKGKNPMAEDSDSGCNSRKSHMTWTPLLHQKFLGALDSAGKDAQPKRILSIMNEPGLTYDNVASHLQNHRKKEKRSDNLVKSASPVMSTVLPAAPPNIFPQGRTSGSTANFNFMEARGSPQIQRSLISKEAPNIKGKGLDNVKQKLDAFNYSCNNSMNAIIANRGVHSGGSGRVKIARVIDQDHDNTIENYVTNIREQFKVVPRRFGLGAMQVHPEGLESGHLSSRATDVISSSSHLSSALQTLNWKPAGAISDMVVASGDRSSGFMAPNQEIAVDAARGMYGLGNVGNPVNMENRSFGEGTGANQVLDDLPTEEEVNNIIHDLEAYDLFAWMN